MQFKTSSLDPVQIPGQCCVHSISEIYSNSRREIVLLKKEKLKSVCAHNYAVSVEKDLVLFPRTSAGATAFICFPKQRRNLNFS